MLEPLLFILYANDSVDVVSIRLFGDDRVALIRKWSLIVTKGYFRQLMIGVCVEVYGTGLGEI